jgi:hypothetical protein
LIVPDNHENEIRRIYLKARSLQCRRPVLSAGDHQRFPDGHPDPASDACGIRHLLIRGIQGLRPVQGNPGGIGITLKK